MPTKKATKKGWTDKDKFIFYRAFAFVVIIGFIVSSLTSVYLYYKNPNETIKEIKVPVEHVQYIEKSKTPTSEFLTYLNPKLDPSMAKIIGIEVDKASKKYLLPRKLIVAIMRKESNINPFAISYAGAVGLMQVMPKIHKEKYIARNLWHISTNIDVGAEIWKEYFDKNEGHIGKTFHSYLSKNAKKTVAKKYQNEIEGYWAKLAMYDYLTTIEREKAKEDTVLEADILEAEDNEEIKKTEPEIAPPDAPKSIEKH